MRFTLYNTNNNEINTKEAIINNYTDLSLGVIGYVIDTQTNTYPTIYELALDSDSNYIYYNDSEFDFNIRGQVIDNITKIF